MTSVSVGLFDTQTAAENARTQLIAAGFSPSQVTGNAELPESGSSAAQPNEEGGVTGFFRSLFGNDDANDSGSSTYKEAFRRGGYALTVGGATDDEMDRVIEIMEDCGAIDVDEREQQWRSEGWTGGSEAALKQPAVGAVGAVAGTSATAAGTQKVNLVQESLAVGKRAVGRGGVRVFSRVVEVPVEEKIRLREEQADIQRRVVDRPATEADFAAFNEGTFEVHNTAEEAVVSKTARVVGEVEIGTQVTEREEIVRDTVRKTEVDVEQIASDVKTADTVLPGTKSRPL